MNKPKYEKKMDEFFKQHQFVSTEHFDADKIIDIDKLASTLLSQGSYPWNDTVGEMMDEIAGDPDRFGLRIESIS